MVIKLCMKDKICTNISRFSCYFVYYSYSSILSAKCKCTPSAIHTIYLPFTQKAKKAKKMWYKNIDILQFEEDRRHE